MFNFNFQLFAETLEIQGIDEDILKELAEEEEYQEAAEPAEKEEPAKEAEHTEPSADADSDTKQVEGADEFEDVKEGQTIPYDRFKSVNEKRKSAENRIKELEEELRLAKAKPAVETTPGVEKPKQQQAEANVSVSTENFTEEQEKRIYEMAAQRVKSKKNYSDEDIEALEYSDDPTAKMRYQQALSNEVNLVVQELHQYAAEQQRFNTMTAECSQAFDEYSKKLNGYADVQDRWAYISQERFNKLPQRKQTAINDAFMRLQAKKGTYVDIELVTEYFDMANDEWDAAHSQGAKPKPKSNKFNEAQKLPKAPGLNGGGYDGGGLTPEKVADILNTPGAWDKLSPKEQEAILAGNI